MAWKKILTTADDANYKNDSIEAGDVPNLPATKITSGSLPVAQGGTGTTASTGTGKVVLWDSPNLNGSPIIGGTTFPSSTGTAKQVLSIGGTGSATWVDNFPNNVKYFYQQWSMRWQTYNTRYYYPSTSYGPAYYSWTKYSGQPITDWQDSWNPCYYVPEACTYKGAILTGSATQTDTLEMKILKGTPSSNSNSSASVTLASIDSPTAEQWESGKRNQMGVETRTVSLAKGDILVPQLRRTTNTSSGTKYVYATLYLKFQKT
jgi:hypothetical protein